MITGAGRSAVAVVSLIGPAATPIMGKCFVPATDGEFQSDQIRYGTWWGISDREDGVGEAVVVTAADPHDFEIHCHGGRAATMRIMSDLIGAGVTEIDAPQYTMARAASPIIAEATEVLTRCLTQRTAAIAMTQVRGGLHDWAVRAITRLTSDGSGGVANEMSILKKEAAAIEKAAAVTTRLDQPFRVVLVGPPNVGKSSLVNAIVGYDRSIALDIPGTTRDVLHAETVIDGLPIQISDTAGIRESDEAIEREGITRAREAARQADLVIRVCQPGQPSFDDVTATQMIDVTNKADLLTPHQLATLTTLGTVAISGDGIDELMNLIALKLSDVMPPADQPASINRRQADLVALVAGSEDATIMRTHLRNLVTGAR